VSRSPRREGLIRADLPTPCLLLDAGKLASNIDCMNNRARTLGVKLRPHMKTAKSADVSRRVFEGGTGPITVSTLKEARHFLDFGFTDILYAVEISPDKIDRALAIHQAGADLILTVDSLEMATAVATAAGAQPRMVRVVIEIDTDRHRAGLPPGDSRVISVAQSLNQKNVCFHGLMTHAGESYKASVPNELAAHAELERASIVGCAERLRAAGVPCATVSVGSTPTLTFARNLTGVTEVRAGVYMFQDLFQANMGVCDVADIALFVLTPVIGRRPELGFIIVDAGALALSKDRGTALQHTDYGYGLVCDEAGVLIRPQATVTDVMQEHGLIRLSLQNFDAFPIGRRLRILPNHACMTAAAHECYYVIDSTDGSIATWSRCNGW
jgi:D-serine deaminase-like pyridoxal phosphate-dependent protein